MSTVHWLGVVTLMSLLFSGPLRGQFDTILFNGLIGYYSLPSEATLNGAAGHTIEVDVQPN